MTMTHIETFTVTGFSQSIDFANIPQDFTDLVLKISARSSTSGISDVVYLGINGQTFFTSNNILKMLESSGSQTYNNGGTGLWIGRAPGSTSTANVYSNHEIYICNYKNATPKSIQANSASENAAVEGWIGYHNMLWNQTAAITDLSIGQQNSWQLGSTISLYGITAGSDGTTTVS